MLENIHELQLKISFWDNFEIHVIYFTRSHGINLISVSKWLSSSLSPGEVNRKINVDLLTDKYRGSQSNTVFNAHIRKLALILTLLV